MFELQKIIRINVRGRLQRTSSKWGRGGGFEISYIPGRGEGGGL